MSDRGLTEAKARAYNAAATLLNVLMVLLALSGVIALGIFLEATA